MGPAINIFEGGGLIPGAGIKFLVDQHNSADFVLLNQLAILPDNNYNFFAVTLSNHNSSKF